MTQSRWRKAWRRRWRDRVAVLPLLVVGVPVVVLWPGLLLRLLGPHPLVVAGDALQVVATRADCDEWLALTTARVERSLVAFPRSMLERFMARRLAEDQWTRDGRGVVLVLGDERRLARGG